MSHRIHVIKGEAPPHPYSGSRLVPMLVGGLVLASVGMIVAMLCS
jgi:hypothetical protein